MKLDDLKQDWQKNIEQVSAPENLNEVIKMLEKETTKIDKEIKRRDFLEISIAVLLIPVWVLGLFISKGSIQTLGYIIGIASCIYIPYKLLSAKKITTPKLSNIKAFLEREKEKVSQQKQLLESIVWWYIAPLTTSIVLITLGATVNETGLPSMNEHLFIYYGCLVLLIVGIYFLNKRAAKKKFGPLLTNIEQRLAEISPKI
jgi:Ca2+/Na+ antiporter